MHSCGISPAPRALSGLQSPLCMLGSGSLCPCGNMCLAWARIRPRLWASRMRTQHVSHSLYREPAAIGGSRIQQRCGDHRDLCPRMHARDCDATALCATVGVGLIVLGDMDLRDLALLCPQLRSPQYGHCEDTAFGHASAQVMMNGPLHHRMFTCLSLCKCRISNTCCNVLALTW